MLCMLVIPSLLLLLAFSLENKTKQKNTQNKIIQIILLVFSPGSWRSRLSSPRSLRSPQSLHLPSHQHESSLQASVPPKPGSEQRPEPCQAAYTISRSSLEAPRFNTSPYRPPLELAHNGQPSSLRSRETDPGAASNKDECPAWSWSHFTDTAPRLSGLRGLYMRNAGAGQ